MFTPKKAKVVTTRPIKAHQADTLPRKPFISRMCNQAAWFSQTIKAQVSLGSQLQ